MAFASVAQIINANKAKGGHYFDPGTMRTFRSRLGKSVFGGTGD